MTTHEEIQDLLRSYPRKHLVDEGEILSYAAGMLNEIHLLSTGLPEPTDEAEIAIVALEGIKKRLTGEET